MEWKEYFIVMKHAGLSWLGHLLPFGVVVASQMQFNKDIGVFQKRTCTYSRFGNSGLFLVFSEETQNKLRESRIKSEQWRNDEERKEELKKLEELKQKYD